MSWRKQQEEEALGLTSHLRIQIRQQFMMNQGGSLTSRMGAGNIPNMNLSSSSAGGFNTSRSNVMAGTGATGEG